MLFSKDMKELIELYAEELEKRGFSE